MDNSKAFAIYSKLPVFMQNAACSFAGLRMISRRYNKTFKNAYEFLLESEWWDQGKQQDYQESELRKIITHSVETVPYYKEMFKELGLSPLDIKSIEDLSKLPVLDKYTLREKQKEILSVSVPERKRVNGKTGGTTGTALSLAYDVDTQPWQWAVWWRHRNRFNIKRNDSFIVFAGRDVVPLDTMKPPFWRRNIPMRQTYVSIHHFSKENLPFLADYLVKRKVKYYSGYPSSLYIVASYFKGNELKLESPPEMTFTGAETLLPHQRKVIEEAFDTVVSDQYGASEHCGNISECENFKYHIDNEFGIVELLPIQGMPSNIRRIICTGLHNYAMPLVRYDIGDIATVSEHQCSCGRSSTVIEKIDGRIESYIITPDGRQLGRLDFLFKKSSNIEEAQLIQEELSCVKFRIVKNHKYGEDDEKKLIQDIHTYMGESFKIDIEYVSSIPREENGKFRQIVSSVFKDKYITGIQ